MNIAGAVIHSFFFLPAVPVSLIKTSEGGVYATHPISRQWLTSFTHTRVSWIVEFTEFLLGEYGDGNVLQIPHIITYRKTSIRSVIGNL